MAAPNVVFPTTYTPAIFGGPSAQGATLPTIPKLRNTGMVPTKESYRFSRMLAAQAAQKAGVDPKAFVSQMSWISGLNPTAKSQGKGISALSPQAIAHINPHDQQQSLDYAAKVMAGMNLLRANSLYNAAHP